MSIYLDDSAVIRWQTTRMFEHVIVRELRRKQRGGAAGSETKSTSGAMGTCELLVSEMRDAAVELG